MDVEEDMHGFNFSLTPDEVLILVECLNHVGEHNSKEILESVLSLDTDIECTENTIQRLSDLWWEKLRLAIED